MKSLLLFNFIWISFLGYAQVDTTFIYNTDKPYGTLDIRIAKSSTRYYYLQENQTFSFRESSPGIKTNTYRDMTSWDSSPYKEGNLREKNGTSDAFIMNYRLLFPVGYQSGYSEGYPLIVMMHGAGERANCWENDCHWADRSWRPSSNNPPAPTSSSHQLLNNDHNMSHGGKQHLDARNLAGAKLPNDPSLSARAFPGFVLFGQTLNGWDTNTTQDLIRLVRLAVKKYNIDPNRIYVHGLSNGGIATYNVIKRAPWLFAAALPMSSPNEASIINNGLLPAVAHIPLWIFQGGRDSEPTPQRTEGYIRKFREAGAEVRYSLYANLGHGTWNSAYAEPDFFSWMRSKSKTRIHVFFNNPSICGSTGEGVKMGLAAGFLAYQWQRDGQTIAGATGPEYVATQPGVYRARFSRTSETPGSSQWENWSQAVTITGNAAGKPDIIPLTTTHLRGPDNAGPNTIQLRSATKNDKYYWYKNGTLINIPDNSEDDTVSIFTITSTSTGDNGAYTLKTGSLDDCQSAASDPVNLFFNNSAPLLSDSNIPSSFRVISVTGSGAQFAWEDRSSVETGYEIWRRAPGESFIMAGRTSANAQSFNDTGLIPSTHYDYKIRVVNNQGRSRYAPGDDTGTNLQVTTSGDNVAPTPPKNLKVVRNTTNSISLSWTASTDNNGAIKHYVVYYGSQSEVTNSADPSYTLTGLPINQSYNITVKAVDHADLFSPASNQVTGSTTVTGLWYGHSTGAWTDLDQITNWDEPEFTGHVPNFTLSPRTQEEYFNFEFTGYLYINTGGNYYFYLNSDDGSRLYIDGNQVVDFDGIHGTSSANEGFGVKSGAISLSAGPHDIRVIFFENISGQQLSVAYEGADTDNAKKYIPDAALKSGNPGSSTNTPPVVTLTNPKNDQQFTAPASISLQATASDSDGNVTKVEFFNGTTKLGEDTSSPFAYSWNNVSAGSYSLIAKATDNDGDSNTSSVDVIVTSGQTCAGSGKIGHEVWTGISGTLVSSIPVNSEPSSTKHLTLFEGPSNIGDNYGSRIHGYICVPASGDYTFWISSNDNSELWLSTDENPANKKRIAYVNGYTNVREWSKHSSQQSAAINLVVDQRYYIEALQKEGVGTDHLAVGWQLPGGTLERPIPGMRLIPYESSGNAGPVASITSPEDGQTFTAPATVTISANASVTEGSISKVEFYNGTTKLGEDASSPYAFTWNNVSSGSYTLVAKAIGDTGSSGSSSVDIVVTSGEACAGAGKIGHEVWTGISGTLVSSIPVNSEPSSTRDLTLFEGPSNIGDNYGSRIHGYICVPASGDYTFWISSNDNSELWLSTDENPANKRRIAFVNGYTNVREWSKHGSQQSDPVNLVASQKYYIEALQKEGVGTDHLAVGWQLPNGTLERPIPGLRLIPFQSSGNNQPVVNISSPQQGQSFSAPASLNITADASVIGGSIVKVEFYNGVAKLGEDATSPYTYSWNNVAAGNYHLIAKATDNNGISASATVDITVMDGGSSCAGTGSIQRELWTGIQYNDVASIPVNSSPDAISSLTIFEDPTNAGDNYGTRVSGYLCVPASGAYTFWIASNDDSELWLSTDDNPANKRRIGYVTGYTNPRQWTKFSTQQSSPIDLVAGQRYYIEALHKEGVGTDHMAVGWQLPNGTLERPIPGNRLSPFATQATTAGFAETNFTSKEGENITTSETDFNNIEVISTDIEIFPNPAQSGVAGLTISGGSGSGETTIEIMRMTGEIIYGDKIYCEANCDRSQINLNTELAAGVYLINVNKNGKRFSKRLLVK